MLHPGVNTTDILSGYIAAIKAIRHLDSSGVLLETITELVKQYMRTRSDTVRFVDFDSKGRKIFFLERSLSMYTGVW